MARSPAATVPDYEAADVLVVSETEKLRALADDVRMRMITSLRERAKSTSELAEELGIPKGTAGHHVKVLEQAELVHVVRTRQVRALTEKYYGRTARLFVIRSEDEAPEIADRIAAAGLRRAAEEVRTDDPARTVYATLHVNLTEADTRRFVRRFERLLEDLRDADTPAGVRFGLAAALYPMKEEGDA